MFHDTQVTPTRDQQLDHSVDLEAPAWSDLNGPNVLGCQNGLHQHQHFVHILGGHMPRLPLAGLPKEVEGCLTELLCEAAPEQLGMPWFLPKMAGHRERMYVTLCSVPSKRRRRISKLLTEISLSCCSVPKPW